MAYQNIPVTDGYQVVQQIANFAATVGWTVHRNSDNSDGNRQVTLSAPGYPCYVTMLGIVGSSIIINGHRGYDSNKSWYEQPDQYLAYDGDGSNSNDTAELATRVVCELRVNPILSVHLFGGMSPTPYLYAAIEKEPGYYRHLTIGHLQKFGTALGGMFWDVSSRRTGGGYQTYYEYHRPPLMRNSNVELYNYHIGGFDVQRDTGEPFYNRFGNDSYNPYSWGGHNGTEFYNFFVANPIAYNARTGLQTPLIFANGYVPFGTAPAIRYVDLTYFEAGDELTIGSDVWKVFPWARRADGVRNINTQYSGPEYEASGMCGIAYLKD